MKIIIIDDELSAIEALRKELSVFEDADVVGTASNGTKGIGLLKEHQPDLLFLDVELPDLSGLDFLEQVEKITGGACRVVMYTAYSSYMLPAFRNKAFDFLLKPIDKSELTKVMQRFYIEQSTSRNTGNETYRKESHEKILFYTNAADFRVVQIPDICLFQYNHDQRVWEAVIAGKQEPIKLKRNANKDTLLSIDPRFIQISQRYIININYLLEVNDNQCRFFPPFEKVDYVKVGRLYRKDLIDRFCSL